MLKVKKILCKLLAIIMVVCAIPTIGTQDVAAAGEVTAQFIDVTRWENCGDIGKGDATLINFKGKYFLVDTGRGFAYGTPGDPLTENMRALASAGIKLTGIIITHAHDDHVGGLEKIIAYNNQIPVLGRKKTSLYYNAAFGTSKMNRISANGPFKKCVAVEPGAIWDVTQNDGVAVSDYEAMTKNGIYVFGSALGKIGNGTSMSADSSTENMYSMMVQIKTNALKGLILGDLYRDGLVAMKTRYSYIFNIPYRFCTVGHHGLRSKNKFTPTDVYNEYAYFYAPLSCSAFVYTSRQDKLTNATNIDNFYALNHYLVVYKGAPTYLSGWQPAF